jgi:hypothetical protein
MATVKRLLVAASCGLVLWGAVAAQAIGLGNDRAFGGPGGPNCLESPEVRVTRPCPPPEDPEEPGAIARWREQLFREYRPR